MKIPQLELSSLPPNTERDVGAGAGTKRSEADMRLKPGLTSDQAFEILSVTATLTWGLEAAATLQTQLRAIAESMDVIGNLDIPEDTEPLFLADLTTLEGARHE